VHAWEVIILITLLGYERTACGAGSSLAVVVTMMMAAVVRVVMS